MGVEIVKDVDGDLAGQLVNALKRPDGRPHSRPVHTNGTGAVGTFSPSPEAADFCDAAHFRTDTEVKVRFSNGSGADKRRDGWSDVRGMATRFSLPDGSATDLIAMTLPVFFTPDGETFLDFARQAFPEPVERASPWQKFRDMLHLIPPMPDPYVGQTISPDAGAMAYADAHDWAKAGVFQAATIGAPTSYVRAAYHAVHTFFVTGKEPARVRRAVRFSWQPVNGVLTTDEQIEEAREKGQRDKAIKDHYLQKELVRRLKAGPAEFTLMMQIGEVGDDFDDPTCAWPSHRVRVMMGTLRLTGMLDDETTEKMSFNPHLLTPGIEPSNDKVLWARKDVYKTSSQERDGTPCPFRGHE